MNTPETMEELKKLLDDPRTGLKPSSNTNKKRQAILGLFEEAISSHNKELVELGEKIKKSEPYHTRNTKKWDDVFNYNKAIDDFCNLIKDSK